MKRKRRSSSTNSSTITSPRHQRSRSTASCSPRRSSRSPSSSRPSRTSPRAPMVTLSEPIPTRTLRRASLGASPSTETPQTTRNQTENDGGSGGGGGRSTRRTTPASSSSAAAANGNSDIRRSGRQRKLSYASFDADYMAADDVIRHRSQQQQQQPQTKRRHEEDDNTDEEEEEEEDSVSENGDDAEVIEDRLVHRSPNRKEEAAAQQEFGSDKKLQVPESPFFSNNHVRFSPSAKPGSPMTSKMASERYSRRSRDRLGRVRLHNVPSDDEQTEFNRRYSRDLRTRRKHQQKRGDDDDDEEEEDRPVRRSARMATIGVHNMHESSHSEFEEEEGEEPALESNRRHRRISSSSTRRNIVLSTSSLPENAVEDMETNGLRRSRRTPKPVLSTATPSPEGSSDDNDEDEATEAQISRSERPKRSRLPVERLSYEANPVRSSRRCSEEIRNLDQYSSDEEFTGQGDRNRRRKRYNMRENRQKINRFSQEYPARTSFRARDNEVKEKRRKKIRSYKDSSSSSSSSDNTDEERFKKRKNKRMSIERSKLMPVNLDKNDVMASLFRDRQKVGSSLADVLPMELDLNVKFESVGGCQEHINSLKEMVVFPLIYPEVFSKFSITPPRGVLFYGPPGTGKTLMARALASECSRDGKKVAFFMRKGADCLSKWIGESERQLRLLFDQAYVMRPSIIFFDEIDGLAPVRSSRQDQIHSSIVSTLLALMDGLDNRGEIIVIGATNRVENIDPALRRPGRFDRELRFGVPTRDARKEILQLHTKTWVPPVLETTLDTLADKTIGYCGADIKGLVAEAALSALRRRYPQVYKTNQKLAIEVDRIEIEIADFFKAMKTLIPSTHRVQDQNQTPLPPSIKPLMQSDLGKICQIVDKLIKADDCCYRPRIAIHGREGQGLTTYLGPAVLHHIEKIPCYKLDIPALFSNSARTPEEALFQIFHDAKRTVPSCIYMPHIYRLFKVMQESVKETFMSLLGDILPNSPLLLIAVVEEPNARDNVALESLPTCMFSKAHQEIYSVDLPNAIERKEYFVPIFQAAVELVPEKHQAVTEEELPVLPVVECRSLTEQEEKRLKKRESRLQRELRIFLRDIWAKLNREQKFFMFRVPVDTEEVYDYLQTVGQPMDFDKMLTKLDNEEYKCAQDFLNDIDLIAENAIAYNSDLNYETNKIICHRARALQDFAYACVKTEMDTDFEEECKEIVARREKLQQELSKPVAEAENSDVESSSKRKRPKKKVSNWAKGESKGKKRLRRKLGASTEEAEEDMSEEEDEEEGTPSNDGNGVDEMVPTGIRIDQSRLNHIQNDLVLMTEGSTVERLERVYSTLMEKVSSYKFIADRTQLPKELQVELDSLKREKNSSRN